MKTTIDLPDTLVRMADAAPDLVVSINASPRA